MCLAVGPGATAERSPLGKLIWSVTGNATRLLVVSTVLSFAAFALTVANAKTVHETQWALISSALLGMILLTVLFNRLPRWAEQSPIHYARYAATAYAMTAGIALALISDGSGRYLALALILLGYLIGISGLGGYVRYARRPHQTAARLLMGGAYATGVVLLVSPFVGNG